MSVATPSSEFRVRGGGRRARHLLHDELKHAVALGGRWQLNQKTCGTEAVRSTRAVADQIAFSLLSGDG